MKATVWQQGTLVQPPHCNLQTPSFKTPRAIAPKVAASTPTILKHVEQDF
jgi:hypothetical protein